MGFRDDREALRARIEVLERELAEAKARLEELADVEAERDRLRARLEALGAAADSERVREAERTARREARRRRWSEASRAVSSFVGDRKRALATGAGVLAIALVVSRCTGVGCSPALDGAPSIGLVELDRTPDPVIEPFSVVPLVASPAGCVGSFPRAPQLVLRGSRPHSVRVVAHGASDLVLAVGTPDGRIACDDDSGGGFDPLVTAVSPAGDARVWVGTYEPIGWADVRLEIHAEPLPEDALSSPAVVLEGPGPDAVRTVSSMVLPVVAAASLDGSCRGFLPASPQLALHLTRPAAVLLEASGSADLVLLARGATIACDDDSGPGNSPRVATTLPAGDHLVFVGTYSATSTPTPVTLTARALEVDRDAAPEQGPFALQPGGEIQISGTGAAEVAPEALGASCGGGLVPARPQLAIELGRASEVSLALAQDGTPFVVVVGPDGSASCVPTALSRARWEPGSHRIYVGARDETAPGPYTLTVRTETSSVVPWTR